MRLIRILMAAIVLGIYGFAYAQSLPEIYRPDPRSPATFVDLDLKIESIICPAWEICVITAKGLYREQLVGLRIHISRTKGRSLGIRYQSIGEASDRLLSVISELYKLPAGPNRFRKETYADLVVLQADQQTMAGKAFFFADGPESKYAELFTNIDKKRGVLQIHEKDPGYRKNVLKALSE